MRLECEAALRSYLVEMAVSGLCTQPLAKSWQLFAFEKNPGRSRINPSLAIEADARGCSGTYFWFGGFGDFRVL